MAIQAIKKKKKKWIPILATKEFSNIEIGETLVADPKEATNKSIEVSMMNLMGDSKKQYVKVSFIIKEIKEGKALTEINKISLMDSHVKRITKRAKEKVDDSFKCTSKDNITFRIKPLLLTRNKTKGSVLTSLRKKSREVIQELSKTNTFNELASMILSYKLQKTVTESIKKIYPLSFTEIRIFKKEKSL